MPNLHMQDVMFVLEDHLQTPLRDEETLQEMIVHSLDGFPMELSLLLLWMALKLMAFN